MHDKNRKKTHLPNTVSLTSIIHTNSLQRCKICGILHLWKFFQKMFAKYPEKLENMYY